MTAAYRLKGLGWFGGCVAVVLGFYLMSLQVAAERKKLDDVNARIDAAQRDIRALETEFDTRANLAQLERWNGDTLALAAPTAGQFVRDEAQLASLDVRGGGTAPVETAQLVVPSMVAPAVAPSPATQPAAPAAPVAVAHAAPVSAGFVQVAAVTVAPAQNPVLIRAATAAAAPARNPALIRAAAVHLVVPAVHLQPAAARLASAERASVAVAKVRPQAVALLDRKLLSDSTLDDILSGARAEAGHRR